MRRWTEGTPIETPEQADAFLERFDGLACEVASDDTYIAGVDDFLWTYVGDADLYSDKAFEVIYRDVATKNGLRPCVYDRRIANGITANGVIVHVRQASEQRDEPADFFVVTADILEGTVTEWRVNNDDQHPCHVPGKGLELILAGTDRQLDVHDGEAHIEAQGILRSHAERSKAERSRQTAHDWQPRILLQADRLIYEPFQGAPEPVGHLRDFTDQLSEVRGHLKELRAIGNTMCQDTVQLAV